MVVNIGADTTEISVLSLGGIVLSKAVKFGGNKLDSQIINAVRKKYNLVIGAKTAEYIKFELGSAIMQEEQTVSVYGRHVVTGLPTRCSISSDVVYECMKEFINQIIDSIKSILERTPPELSADIIDTGIYLTGGSSAIRGLGELINTETELHVNIAENPSECVVRGIKKIIESPKYADIAYIPKDRIID
jgi:rod shape-determining protein MreB